MRRIYSAIYITDSGCSATSLSTSTDYVGSGLAASVNGSGVLGLYIESSHLQSTHTNDFKSQFSINVIVGDYCLLAGASGVSIAGGLVTKHSLLQVALLSCSSSLLSWSNYSCTLLSRSISADSLLVCSYNLASKLESNVSAAMTLVAGTVTWALRSSRWASPW